MRNDQQESVQAALSLVLGSETSRDARTRAIRRLVRQGADILPFVLALLNDYPEITQPAWPDWPQPYTLCGRLLYQLSQAAHLPLAELLQHPAISSPIGPTLWNSLIEATTFEPQVDHQNLLRQGLMSTWDTVRYAAAMALGTTANLRELSPDSRLALYDHLEETESYPIRLSAAYALLNSGDVGSLDTLLQLMEPARPTEIRKAAIYILSGAQQEGLSPDRYRMIISSLIQAMHDPEQELAMQAASTCGRLARASILSLLKNLLDNEENFELQIVVLHALETLATRQGLRRIVLQSGLLASIIPCCNAELPTLRRKGCSTLAAFGGEYASAVLATMLYDEDHPGHLEAIESMPLLRGIFRSPLRQHTIRWLQSLLLYSSETTRAVTLDTLNHLLKRAHRYRKPAWHEICQELLLHGDLPRLLHDKSGWVRQRALEILPALGNYRDALPGLQHDLERILLADKDSAVRACAAYTVGQINAHWALSAVIQALLDPNKYVAQTALHTLEQLASPADPIVVYVLSELARLQENDEPGQTLIYEARQLLQKWRRFRHDHSSSTLHGTGKSSIL